MKKVILSVLLIFYTTLLSDEVQLKQEIQQLKKEIRDIKNSLLEHQQETQELYEIAESAEANSFADRLKFGLSFKTYLDNFNKKYADGHTIGNTNILSTKLMLNISANIEKNMRFHGRLSMYKYWGSAYIHPFSYYDNMQGRVPSDSALYVERAYLDWFILNDTMLPVALTIGRQPSADGPSYQFKENITRKATYSALLYDGASDGAVITFDISKLISYKKSYLRLGYAKGFGYSENGFDIGNAYIGPSNSDIKDTNVAGIFVDTVLPNIKKSLVQFSYSKMFDIVANPLDTNSSRNKNIGDVELFGAMVEIENLNNLNLDLFIHYAHSIATPNGEGYLNYGSLLGSYLDSSKKDGDAFWIGSRYGFGKNKRYKIGLEYNRGSKNWINLTQGSFDVYNKLSTRGDAFEAYVMYVINRYSNIRLGYVDIDYQYSRSGWFVGEPIEIDDMSSSSEVDRLKSIYLKMSVNF
jgi:regulator of RNase E activity RraB